MKDFLKMSLATVVGLLVFSAITTVFSLFFFIAVAALGNTQPQIPDEGVLKIDMSTFVLTEQSTEANPLEMLKWKPASC